MKRWMVLGLLVCACGSDNGGGSSGPGSITGTVGGQPLNVKDAVFVLQNNEVLVLVVDRENICSVLSGTTLPGTTTAMFITMANFSPPASVNPHVTGDYAFFDLGGGTIPGTAGRYWFGGFESVDTSCMATTTTFATGGTVTVTQVGNNSGTNFKANLTNLNFGTGTLNGSIQATYCAALATTPCGQLVARPPGPAE